MTRANNFVENGGRLCRTLARSVSVDVDPNVQKFFSKFSVFFREVTPDSPSPRKPHINTGIRSNKLPLNQQPLWGGFGVCGAPGSYLGTAVPQEHFGVWQVHTIASAYGCSAGAGSFQCTCSATARFFGGYGGAAASFGLQQHCKIVWAHSNTAGLLFGYGRSPRILLWSQQGCRNVLGHLLFFCRPILIQVPCLRAPPDSSRRDPSGDALAFL